MHRTMLIEREIRDFLTNRGVGAGLAANSELVSTGLLDSLLIMDLIAFVEQAYCVRLENDDVSPENFRTTAALAAMVNGRRADVVLA